MALGEVDWLLRDVNWAHFATIPMFTAVVGWLINWTGLLMLFNPIYFHGKPIRGVREIATILPRRLQEIPGILQGGIGWQGIIPARAAKMGSLVGDKAIAKLGTPADFYQQLEPDKIADRIVEAFRPEIPVIVDDIMRRERPKLWRDVPPAGKQAMYARVQRQLPSIIHGVFDDIGTHINQLLDPKLMIVDHFEKNPALVTRIFKDFGHRELNLMVNFGFIFGFLLGIPLAIIDHWIGEWWVLPIVASFVGWATNELGMWLIFEPAEKRKFGPITMQGLFARRQVEAADTYAEIIAEDVITLKHIGDHLLYGPAGDRTRHLLTTALRPAIDRAAGPLHGAMRVAVGAREYDAIRESVTTETVDRTFDPFHDEEFVSQQSHHMEALIAQRTRELPPRDFVDMMRSAIKEDEWLLYLHGAVMGCLGGFLHLWVIGTGGG